MSSTEFIKQYEAALGTQDWAVVAPLISGEARVVFSDGSVHAGKDAIRTAYERNFTTIKNDEYRVENIHWLLETSDNAAYMFDFFWAGVIQGREAWGQDGVRQCWLDTPNVGCLLRSSWGQSPSTECFGQLQWKQDALRQPSALRTEPPFNDLTLMSALIQIPIRYDTIQSTIRLIRF